MKDRAPHAWRRVGGEWKHCPTWKVWANKALRAVQPWSRKFVFYTLAAKVEGRRPRATGYGFGRVLHVDN